MKSGRRIIDLRAEGLKFFGQASPCRAKAEFRFDQARCLLTLDLSSKDKVLDARFILEGSAFSSRDFEVFNHICETFIGKDIQDLFKQDWNALFSDSFFPLFPWLLRKALHQYWGVPQSLDELKEGDPGPLVCRCFGVYRKDLESVIMTNPELTTHELAVKTKASLGCTSCAQDLEQILHETREQYQLKEQVFKRYDRDGKWMRPMGLTPAQVVLKLAPLLEQWLKRENLETHSAEIVDICGHRILISGQLNQDQLNSVQDYWYENLGVRFSAFIFVQFHLQ